MGLNKKILLITPFYPPQMSGVPRFYYHLTKDLSYNEICILTSKIAEHLPVDEKLDFKLYRTHYLTNYSISLSLSSLWSNVILLFLTVYIVLRERTGLILLGYPAPGLMLICYLVKIFFRKDYLLFCHGDGDSPKIWLKRDVLKKFLFARCKTVIVNSKFTRDRLAQKYTIPLRNFVVMYPGVDINKFRPMTEIELTENIRNYAVNIIDKNIILTVGRLDERKGHEMVIKALPYVKNEIPNISYLIAGDGSFRSQLEKQVHNLGLSDCVHFLGAVSDQDLLLLFNLCDAYVMPNREMDDGDTEGFGMVFIEANACRKPVIAGRCGGAVEAVKENVSGLLVNSMDTKDIARNIIKLLNDKQLAQSLGENGFKRAVAEFNWQKKCVEFQEIINRQ